MDGHAAFSCLTFIRFVQVCSSETTVSNTTGSETDTVWPTLGWLCKKPELIIQLCQALLLNLVLQPLQWMCLPHPKFPQSQVRLVADGDVVQ